MKSSRESLKTFMQFCKLRDENTALQLLQEGASVDDSDEDGITPLHVASAVGAENIVKLLLLKGADVDKTTNIGWTPIMYAARNGHSKCVWQLMAYGANICHHNKFGISVLSMATASGNKELIEILLQAEQRESLPDNVISPLHITALLGHSHTLPSLLHSQIHLVNKCDKYGVTPLMLAVAGGHEEVIKVLLDFGADTNLHNSHQFTALDIAYTKQLKKIIHLLADKTEKGDELNSNSFQSSEIGTDLIEQYGWSSVCTPKLRRSTWHNDTPKEITSFNFPSNQKSTTNSNIPSQVNEDISSLFTPVHLPLNEFPEVSINRSLEKNVNAETNATCVPVPPVSPYTNCSSSPFNFPKTITPKNHHSLSSLSHYYPYQIKQSLEHPLKEEYNSLEGSSGKFQRIRKLEKWFHRIFTSWHKKSKTKNNSSHYQKMAFSYKDNSQHCENKHEGETSSSFQNNGRWKNINSNFISPTSSLKNILISHKLQTYIPLFVEHEVDMYSFFMLSEEDIEEMGISSPKSKSKLLEVIMNFQENC